MFAEREGELVALAAAVCWSGCSICFAKAGRKTGSLTLNVFRLTLALIFIGAYSWWTRGLCLPTDASAENWLWLSLSGFVGFFLGDLFLFWAFVSIGPRLSLAVFTTAAPITAIVGWFWIDETLGLRGIFGMLLTLIGVAWVVLERRRDKSGKDLHVSPIGVLCAFLGAAGQGVGAVLGKVGMNPALLGDPAAQAVAASEYDAASATQIRAIAGLLCFLAAFAYLRRFHRLTETLRDRRTVGLIVLGAALGPALGVSLLMRSFQLINSGIAQTLVSIVPVLVLPLVVLFENEKVTWRAVGGAGMAFLGVAVLLWPEG